MTRQLFLLLALACSAPQNTQKRATSNPSIKKQSVRVATFNAHRFFDTSCDSGRCGAGAYEEQPSEEEFLIQAEKIAQALTTLDADIILLQEIESQACLEAINASLRYQTAVVGETGGDASLDVAILSRGVLQQVNTHRQKPLTLEDGSTTNFSRELLELRLSFDGSPVIALAAHFRSKVKDDAPRRLAEASAVRDILQALSVEAPTSLIVFGGDLNDTPDSATLTMLESKGSLQRAAKELGEDAATFVYKGSPQAIDHLYLVLNGGGLYQTGSAKVHWGLGVSDHAALSAEFIFP
jgi:predicted extracellular nuclease